MKRDPCAGDVGLVVAIASDRMSRKSNGVGLEGEEPLMMISFAEEGEKEPGWMLLTNNGNWLSGKSLHLHRRRQL
jgi:hypothetical protein